MNDQDDDLRSIALAVVAGVVALVIGGVIALSSATLPDALPTASKNLATAEDDAGAAPTRPRPAASNCGCSSCTKAL
jgi:hypothetical protein